MCECRHTGRGTSFVFPSGDVLEEVSLEVALGVRHAHLLLGLPRAVRVLQTDAVTATHGALFTSTGYYQCRRGLVVKSPETY